MVSRLRRRGQRGALLLELLAVLAVIALAAAAVLPLAGVWRGSQLHFAARQMEADLRWLQQATVNFSDDQAAADTDYAYPALRIRTGSPSGYYITQRGRTIRKRIFPAPVEIVGVYPNAVYFTNNGYVNRPLSIGLAAGRDMLWVVVDAAGRVRVRTR